MWCGDRTLAHFCQAGFAFIFFHLSSFLSCGEISSCFSQFFWFLRTVSPLQETKPMHTWTGLSPIFWSNFFTHFVLCGHFASDRPSLPRRNSRQFFLRRFGSHLVLCGRFPSDRSSLPRQNSRQFFRSLFFSHSVLWGHFLRINLLCLDRTLAIFLRNKRQCPDFLLWFSIQKWNILMSFWGHFGLILRSFWGLLDHFGTSGVHLGSSLGQRGLQVNLNTFFPPLFWDPFWTFFRYVLILMWKSATETIAKSSVCSQTDF